MAREEYSVVVEMDDDNPILREELEFQDFSSGSGVGGKITQDKQQTSSHTGFNEASFFEPHETRTEQQSGQYPFWAIEYYAHYFDVNTDQVLVRAFKSLYPKEEFTEVVGHNVNTDLYGPFWISTTVIFLLFVTSSIAGSIAAIINGNDNYSYDFKILSFGVAAIYTYTFGIPLFVWVALKYFGCKPSLLNVVGLYGYGLTVWIPVSVSIFVIIREFTVRRLS
ncbi:16073_t:CDS:2 [Acaulospora colombiana]|uniref:16073_t:CDS:1 n=1 Tax=Acaulospora colombiana TaxID=27376 RepID=A0ACA9KCM7_9GLOM|nr:16073_t:CDS:2 [Acaulospora colombiana]